MKVDAQVKQIQNLKDYFFVVPDYQREYVWKADENVIQFLDDINDEFNANRGKEIASNYFIGSIITVDRDDGSNEVIDGQQRLTTIIIALCAIRDLLEKEAPPMELAEDYKEFSKAINELLYQYSIEDRKRKPRLELQYEESKDYLLNLIEKKEFEGEFTKSVTRMSEAYQLCSNYVGKMDIGSKLDLVGYLLAHVDVVMIKPETVSSALKIFETINERGVGLNAMDLLKNLIFREAKESDFTIVKETWQRLIKSLEGCGEDDRPLRFLRYFLMARYYDGILREDKIYDWIISNPAKEAIGYQKDPIRFAKELSACASKYSQYVIATESKDFDQKYPSLSGIGHIGRTNFRQHLILLLALNEIVEEDGVSLLSQKLETLILYYVVCRENPRDFERKFSSWAKDIRKLSKSEELKDFIDKKFGEEVGEREKRFEQMFMSLSQSDLSPMYRTKYVLGRIEEYIRAKCNVPTRNSLSYFQNLELEHTLPQTPKDDKLPPEFESKNEYREFVFRFGNLNLAEETINKSLQAVNNVSDPTWFDGKLKEYSKSEVLLTRSISHIERIGKDTAFNSFVENYLPQYSQWKKTNIEYRQETLYALVKMIWTLTT